MAPRPGCRRDGGYCCTAVGVGIWGFVWSGRSRRFGNGNSCGPGCSGFWRLTRAGVGANGRDGCDPGANSCAAWGKFDHVAVGDGRPDGVCVRIVGPGQGYLPDPLVRGGGFHAGNRHVNRASAGADGDGGRNPGGRELAVWRFLGRAGGGLGGFRIHSGYCPSYCVDDCGDFPHINNVPGLTRRSGRGVTGGVLWQSCGANYWAAPQFPSGAKPSIC